jgi:predicted amidohydrolase
MNVVRAAVVQDSPVVLNRKATLEKVHSLINRAAREGARRVVIPEAFVSAYLKGLDFGARIGLRSTEGREDYAAIQGNDPATVLMRGGSCIIGPLGQILAGPNFEGPCILTADLDLDEIPRSKYDFDVVGHYSRPDIFRLYVNTRPTLPVVVSSGDDEPIPG